MRCSATTLRLLHRIRYAGARSAPASQAFWEALGFVAMDEELQPFPRTALTSDHLNLALYRTRAFRQPVLTFEDARHARAHWRGCASAASRCRTKCRTASTTRRNAMLDGAGRNATAAAAVRGLNACDTDSRRSRMDRSLACCRARGALLALPRRRPMKACGRSTTSRRPRCQAEVRRRHRQAAGWIACSARSRGMKAAAPARSSRRDGLVLTNHHCAMECLAELSSRDRELRRGRLQRRDTRAPSGSARRKSCRCWSTPRTSPRRSTRRPRGSPTRKANEARKQALSRLEERVHARARRRIAQRSARLRIGDAVSGRPVLPLQVPPLRRRAPGVRAA